MRWPAAFARGAGLLACLAAWSFAPARVQARRFYRARFETEALELEQPGEIEIDGQIGGFYGDGPDKSRLLLPDFEIDLGVCSWLEIDLDAALSLTQFETATPRLAGDPIWLAARVDALNWRDPQTDASFGIGLQVGPRLSSLHTPRGLGVEGLLLFGGGTRRLHLVGNVGGLFDHGQAPAILFGVDAEYELNERWSLLGDVAAAHYFSSDPGQLFVDVGAAYHVSKWLSFSLLAVGGPVFRGDRAGALVGVSYSFQAWGRRSDEASTQAPGPQ